MNYQSLSDTLQQSLRLSLPPVAVTPLAEVPAGVPRFDGRVAAGCQFWQEAAKRTFVTVAADHALCSIGIYTHRLPMAAAVEQDLNVALKVFADLGYVRPEDLAQIPTLSDASEAVVYGPLADTPVAPATVLLFVTPEQQLILAEAVQQVEGQWMTALGRPACAIVPQAIQGQKASLSLGCCGARVYVDALAANVALYAIPGAKLAAYVERIAALSKANEVLTKFHQIRRTDVEAGGSPTIPESLARLG